jgi:hypothetical protein
MFGQGLPPFIIPPISSKRRVTMPRIIFALLCSLPLTACFQGSSPVKPAAEGNGTDPCNAVATAMAADEMQATFRACAGSFEAGCRDNDGLARLWRGLPRVQAEPKRVSYCRISPVFRACFVCTLKTGDDGSRDDPEHRQAYLACRRHLSETDRVHAAAIWP